MRLTDSRQDNDHRVGDNRVPPGGISLRRQGANRSSRGTDRALRGLAEFALCLDKLGPSPPVVVCVRESCYTRDDRRDEDR
jgi:hypothetical protein